MFKLFKKIFNVLIYGFTVIGAILMLGFVAIKSGLTNNTGLGEKSDYFNHSRLLIKNESLTWQNSAEYQTLAKALIKEKSTLDRVEKETGIKARLLISFLVVEQLRLYNSDRELFKKVFEPLKIIGVQSQYSWGVLGLKRETLIKIEDNLKDSKSEFYLGDEALAKFGPILELKTDNKEDERFQRIIDPNNHYYTYLYAGLFLKQIENQWEKAGFPISDMPEILATLYNLGFEKSIPKANPETGGAEIEIAGEKISFGRLAYQFYYSNELLDVFPR